jgi:hypothetical protein
MRFCVLFLTLVVAGSCGPTPAPLNDADLADTGSDAFVATCETAIEIPIGDPDGHPDPLAAPVGEARAGRIEESELPVDRTGLATWAAGDFVLANEHVAAIVEATGPSDLFDPFGGKLVGVGLMEDGHIVRAADFEEVILGVGLYTLDAESVTVLHDGSDGQEAVIRSVGTMRLVPFLAEFAGRLFGMHEGLRVAIDHALAPGSHAVEVRFHLAPDRPGTYAVTRPVQVILQASRMPPFVAVHGFETSASSTADRLLFEDEEGASYAWESADGPLTRVIEAGGAGIYTSPAFSAEGCALGDHVYGRITIAGPGLAPLRRVLAEAAGDTLRIVDVSVTEGGAPATGAHVVARTPAGEVFVRMRTDATGHARLALPPEAMTLSATRDGQWLVADQALAASESSATLVLPTTGMLHVRTLDALDAPLPSRVQVVPETALVRPPPSFGEAIEEGGRLHLAFAATGEVTLRVPPGVHRVIVSRGYEYELHDERVVVVAGETVEVAAHLARSVDTPGMLSADFHIHTNRSPDSPDSGERKIRNAVAEGLEVPVRSDHEWVNDFDDEITALGVEASAFGVSSLELTTYVWGHFGVFPLDEDPSLPNGGAVEWAFRTPTDVFADAMSRTGVSGAAALIVNHPRNGGSAGAAFAYFNAAGYDPITGTAERADLWDDSFSAIEVFNDSAFDANEATTVRDWFSFLSAGRRMFAVGSSDSHGVSGSPVGYPRTWVALGTDDPAELRAMGAGAVRDAVLAGHATIGGGIFVMADVDGHGPGEIVSGAAARTSVHVVVSAPSWVDVDRLRVYVDGAMTVDTEIVPADPIVRFDDTIEVDVASGGGSYVVVVATGDHDLEPVHPGRLPFGVTNPIFLVR